MDVSGVAIPPSGEAGTAEPPGEKVPWEEWTELRRLGDGTWGGYVRDVIAPPLQETAAALAPRVVAAGVGGPPIELK